MVVLRCLRLMLLELEHLTVLFGPKKAVQRRSSSSPGRYDVGGLLLQVATMSVVFGLLSSHFNGPWIGNT